MYDSRVHRRFEYTYYNNHDTTITIRLPIL